MLRTTYLMLALLVATVTMSCTSVPTIYDYTPNQTGLLACRYAAETTGPIPTHHEHLVYGDATVQSRTQARNGTADCYEKLEQK